MSKLLVVPPPEVLPAFTARRRAAKAVQGTWVVRDAPFAETAAYEDGGVAMISTPMMEPVYEAVFTPSLRDELLSRRQACESFAAQHVKHAPPLDLASAMSFEAEAPAEAPFEVLEGLGVIIMDDAWVDREELLAAGAQFYEDDFVELVAPVASEMAEQQSAAATVDAEDVAVDTWHLAKINIAAAHDRGLTGKGVLIGVLDTGIDASHPDLQDVLAGPEAFAEFDVSGTIVTTTPHEAKPDATHGTHVCGLLAGKRTGVAPGARLAVAAVMTTKTFLGYGGQLTQISRGLNWLLTTTFDGELVDLVNVSLGRVPYNDYLYHVTTQARDRGVVTAAAIGNSGEKGENWHGSPANYDLVVGVGATDASDAAASFSDWGTVSQHDDCPKPDLCAPGVKVWSCVRGGGYGAMDGTSMATPLVTGAAALLIEQREELRDDPDALIGALFALVQPATPAPRVGRGRLDLTQI